MPRLYEACGKDMDILLLPSPREQSHALNTEIDGIYDRLATLVAKRRAGDRDPVLEEEIAQLFQRLRTLQMHEANLIRGMILSTRTSNVETGLAILKRVEQLREKYGDPTTTSSCPSPSHQCHQEPYHTDRRAQPPRNPAHEAVSLWRNPE